MPLRYNQPIHANNNILCAVAIETTGTKPYWNEICEICVMPLKSNYRPLKDVMPFNMMIRPRNTDRIDEETMSVRKDRLLEIMKYGTDSFEAGDMFIEWFDRLKMLPNKNILPVTYNWAFNRPFIYDWLGPLNADYTFNYRYRDILPIANFLNDYQDWRINNCPFPKHHLQYLSSCAGIERTKPHNVMQDCVVIAGIYRAMLSDSIVTVAKSNEQDPQSEIAPPLLDASSSLPTNDEPLQDAS